MRSFLRWRRPDPGSRRAGASSTSSLTAEDLGRAARLLSVRSRREATGLFAGSYASAFRGGGIEFDESRPYVPGDDVRNLDWNAMARTGEPFVKRFREERDEVLLVALDISKSMRFGTTGRSKAATAAHAAALLASAAGAAGDRIGLLCFDDGVRVQIPPDRGAGHTWRVIEAAVAASRDPAGGTRLAEAIDAILALRRQRTITVILSDFRISGESGDQSEARDRSLARLARRHDVVCGIVHDPREESLPRAGLIRVSDPEYPQRSVLLNSSSSRVRRAYRRSWALRAASLERALRTAGGEVLWLRTDREPLQTLMHFFRMRAADWRAAV